MKVGCKWPSIKKNGSERKISITLPVFRGQMFGENFMQKLISYPMISALHLVKIARLVAHHWKNHPKWLLERCRICMTFWGRFGPSKLRHNFFVFQIIVKSGIIFAIKSCQINWLNRRIHNLEICLQKNVIFLKNWKNCVAHFSVDWQVNRMKLVAK